MYRLFKLGAAVVAVSLLSGCGEEDFTGAYRYTLPGEALVLNIEGGEAKIFAEKEGRVLLRSTLTASVKDEKLFLDTADDAKRVVMKRNVDERSLDCLNCKVLSFGKDEVHWKYDPHGVYDVDQLLKEQARKDEEVAARLSTYGGIRDHVVKMCMESELQREVCECVPKELKKMGISDAEFIKRANPKFRSNSWADEKQQTEFAGSIKKATLLCIDALP